ncbi:MAG: tetratricopeptide repeat protein, partial [Bacteroidia bacterium]
MKNLIMTTLFCAFVWNLHAQNIPADTIEYARSKAYKKDFVEADRLLTIYTNNNNSLDAMRLHAQVLYWMKKFDRSAFVFETMLKKFPDANVVKLDYGRLLFETNKLSHAELLLNNYLKSDPKNPEANILLAEINYWKGHIKTAKEKINVVLQQYPDNANALAVLQEINSSSAPYVSAGYDYASDDQPLQKATLNAKFGWYQSWLFSPLIEADAYNFTLNEGSYNSSWLQAGNKIFFGNSGFSMNFKGGLFKHPAESNVIFTGSGMIAQKISKSLSFSAGTGRMPYLYTTTSILTSVMQQLSDVAINLDKSNKWLGKAAWQLQK